MTFSVLRLGVVCFAKHKGFLTVVSHEKMWPASGVLMTEGFLDDDKS